MEPIRTILPDVLSEGLKKVQPINTESSTNPESIKAKKIEKIKAGKFSDFPTIFQTSDVSDFTNKYRYAFDDSVLILGKCGTGKTHLAVALFKDAFVRCIENDIEYPRPDNLFYNFQTVAIRIKSAFKDGSDSMEAVIKPLMNMPKIIDDICTAKPTETAIETLYCIVNHRYEYQIPTIYTSNLSMSEISEMYGDRIASRLSACRIIKLEGKDRRVK